MKAVVTLKKAGVYQHFFIMFTPYPGPIKKYWLWWFLFEREILQFIVFCFLSIILIMRWGFAIRSATLMHILFCFSLLQKKFITLTLENTTLDLLYNPCPLFVETSFSLFLLTFWAYLKENLKSLSSKSNVHLVLVLFRCLYETTIFKYSHIPASMI